MKSKTLKQNKVNIITLGCSKNLVDSEMLSGQLLANEIEVVHENKNKKKGGWTHWLMEETKSIMRLIVVGARAACTMAFQTLSS